jgi:hypothetical protein
MQAPLTGVRCCEDTRYHVTSEGVKLPKLRHLFGIRASILHAALSAAGFTVDISKRSEQLL